MNQVKDTARAIVRLGFDGRVHKTFRGPHADTRFANEVRVLQYLEQKGCPFVPRLLEQDPENLRIITTNCGSLVERMDPARMAELFAELEQYGVRHDDAYLRNVTYSRQLGRFCLIDFEFATILEDAPASPVEAEGSDPATAGSRPEPVPVSFERPREGGRPSADFSPGIAAPSSHPIQDHR